MSSHRIRIRYATIQVLLIVGAIIIPFHNTFAAEALPGESCAGLPSGTFRQSSGPEITGGHMLVCDGTNWLSVLSYNAGAEVTTIGNQSCNNGEVLAFNGTAFACSKSGIWETNTNVTRPTSGVANYATDDFVFGSYQLDDIAGTDDNNRMYFDKSKGAFRAGRSYGTEWNASTLSVGIGSAAFGFRTTASGQGSTAWGNISTATGTYSTAWGGGSFLVNGGTASGPYSTAFGGRSTASSDYSTAWGFSTHAGSYAETSLGRYSLDTAGTPGSWVATDTLFEIGNGASSGSRANALTLLKNGKLGLGDSSPDGSLLLDVEGDIGAINYCDEAGNNCFTAATAASSVWETNTNVTRPTSGVANYATDDFVFGAAQLDNIAGVNDDKRMFFDKSKGAFRAGQVSGTQWDAINVGLFSTAFGDSTTASGLYSTAFGDSTTASEESSTAFGVSTTASGQYSTAFGEGSIASNSYSTAFGALTTASGSYSTAWGESSTASGSYSTAFGLLNHAGSYAETSLGRFSLNTAGTPASWVATDTLFEIGNGTGGGSRANAITLLKNGNFGIGTASPQSTLHIPDGNYLQAEDNNAGAPPAGDCDADAERGRMSIDTTNNRLYVCMGATRGWDYSSLTD